jgi:hypothetical protein
MNSRKKKMYEQILTDKIQTWDIGCPWKCTSSKIVTARATTVRTKAMARRLPPPAGDVGPFS